MKEAAFFDRFDSLFQRANHVAWETYEETIYHMQRPITYGNFHRVKQFVGGNPPELALRDAREFQSLDRALNKGKYPRCGHLTRFDEYVDGNTEFATALLHFYNPAYPIFDALTVRGLNHLGHPINYVSELDENAVSAYQAYVNLIQEYKEKVPFLVVPEKNYYLTRVVQMCLWQLGLESPVPGAKASKERASRA